MLRRWRGPGRPPNMAIQHGNTWVWAFYHQATWVPYAVAPSNGSSTRNQSALMRARAAPARAAPARAALPHAAPTHSRKAESMAPLNGERTLPRPPSRWVGEIADASVSNSWAALLPGGPADDHAGETPSLRLQPDVLEAAALCTRSCCPMHLRPPPYATRSARGGAERQALRGPIAVGHAAGTGATTERRPAGRAAG